MIGYIRGKVLYSNGGDALLVDGSGVGHHVTYHKVLREESEAALYISHVIREDSQHLYAFDSLRAKKLFEALLGVKGVGPKSAFSLIVALGEEEIIGAITGENKKRLSQAPGIGPKAAAQIILDLSTKIKKALMSVPVPTPTPTPTPTSTPVLTSTSTQLPPSSPPPKEEEQQQQMIDEALSACRELGFEDEQVTVVAQKVMRNHDVGHSSHLVHLVLKEL